MPYVFETLGTHHSRFDAVSVCDLPFWVQRADDPFAREYFEANKSLSKTGKDVTRLFLVSRSEFRAESVLTEVLHHFHRAGIGFALVPYDELPPGLRLRGWSELDFGIWDYDRAYSAFRDHRPGWIRSLKVVFSVDFPNQEITSKYLLYKQMLLHAWMVDRRFKECHRDLISEMSSARARMILKSSVMTG